MITITHYDFDLCDNEDCPKSRSARGINYTNKAAGATAM